MVQKQRGEISKRSQRIQKRSCKDYGQREIQPIVQAFGNLMKLGGDNLEASLFIYLFINLYFYLLIQCYKKFCY